MIRHIGVVAAVLWFGAWCGPPASGASPAPPPEVWVVDIGINQYDDHAIPACPGALSDSIAVADWFVKTAGWPEGHVALLNDLGRRGTPRGAMPSAHLLPTRQNLDWVFSTWLPERVRPGDAVVIYFAGHAVSLPTRPQAVPGAGGRDYLLPIDARWEAIDETGWPIGERFDKLALQGNNPIVCWLDTSPQGRGKPLPWKPDEVVASPRLLSNLARWPGVTAWMASETKPAPDGEGQGANRHSPFVHRLLATLGTREDHSPFLLASLSVLNADREVTLPGFRTQGGVHPGFSLWPGESRVGPPSRELVVQRGHADRIEDIAFTADDRWMTTASRDSTVRLWNAADQSLVQVLSQGLGGVSSLALSADGRWLAFGDRAGKLWFWNVHERRFKTGSGATVVPGVVDYVGFTPDSRAAVSHDLNTGAVLLWDLTKPGLSARAIQQGTSQLTCAPNVLADPAKPTPQGVIAASEPDGTIHLFLADGTRWRTLKEFQGEAVTALEFSADGAWLAAGGENGRVLVIDCRAGLVRPDPVVRLAGTVKTLRFGGKDLLAIGTTAVLELRRIGAPKPVKNGVLCDNGVEVLAFQGDCLAALDGSNGPPLLWRVGGGEGPEVITLKHDDTSPRPSRIAFTHNGRELVAGDAQGGLHFWDVRSGRLRASIAANPYKVAHLRASSSRKSFLQISARGTAHLWALGTGRGAESFSGRWSDGDFLPDGSALVLLRQFPEAPALVLFGLKPAGRRALEFDAPQGGFARTPFDKLAVAPDGTRVAAGSTAGYKPAVCVWDIRDGTLSQTIRYQEDPKGQTRHEALKGLTLHALCWAGKRLVTCVDRGATLWELPENGPAIALQRVELPDADFTAVAARNEKTVALGTSSGRVYLWDFGTVGPNPRTTLGEPLPGSKLAGAVRALAFTGKGQWLSAAGEDTTLRVWRFDEKGRPAREVALGVVPQHGERINTLAAWPDGPPLLVSGSDDTTVRLWNLAEGSLLGTFSVFPTPTKAPERRTVPLPSEWIVFTPDGVFDRSNVSGNELAKVVEYGEARALEQFERHHSYELAATLGAGTKPLPKPDLAESTPRLAIDVEGPGPLPAREVTVIVQAPKAVSDLRLYQNGQAVRAQNDFVLDPKTGKFRTTVSLVSGKNRFYAMAGSGKTIDSRSPDVVRDFEGAAPPGRLHVIALGVSRYNRRALRYADHDANAIADFLADRGTATHGVSGSKRVLINEEVTIGAVDQAFDDLQKQVRAHPEDKVVVFLAGHTSVLDNLFCLLLPGFPFPRNDPLLADAREAASLPEGIDQDQALLHYARIYSRLVRLDALQRLVIIDACQAEAILDDRGIQELDHRLAAASNKGRVSYLFAARRGEAAQETSELEHGLLTYTLLRGLRAPGLKPLRPDLAALPATADADLDQDRTVTVSELQSYVAQLLPGLDSHYRTLVKRGAADRADDLPPERSLDQGVRLENRSASFPLLILDPIK